MKPIDKKKLQAEDLLWIKTEPVTIAQHEQKLLTVYFIFHKNSTANRFQVWNGLELLLETASLEAALKSYNVIEE